MKTSGSLFLGACCLTASVLGPSAPRAAEPSAPAAAPTHAAGVWQQHTYSFLLLGFTSIYSCDGLADKLKVLLLAAGARSDVVSRPGACIQDFGHPDKFARADLTFYTLSPASGDGDGTTPVVDGVWRETEITARKPREIELGDCELVDQFRTSVLPMFTARNVDNRTTCIPHQLSGSALNLKFETLRPAVQKTSG